MKPLLLPLGIDRFEKIREENKLFVDKSLLIRDIAEDPAESILITRPRRFGKTLNLSMLQCFFSCHTSNDPRMWFEGLSIMQAGDEILKHMGQFPLIFLSLKNMRGKTFSNLLAQLTTNISMLCSEHRYLLSSPELLPSEKKLLERYLDGQASQEEYASALLRLSSLLASHWGRRVMILIDEYDTPIQQAYMHECDQPMLDLMRQFLCDGLKSNPFLHRAILTGILRVSKESIFSGANQIKTYSVTHDRYAPYFGFTQDEVDSLLSRAQLTDSRENIKHWYNGYQMGQKKLYNPWSMVNFISENGRFDTYWVNTSENTLIQDTVAQASIKIKMEFEALLSQQEITVPIDEHLVFRHLRNDEAHLWYLLLASGYLTPAHPIKQGEVKLRLPNQELHILFEKMIHKWFQPHGQFNAFIHALIHGESGEAEKHLGAIMLESLSYFDTEKRAERVYHAFVLGLMVNLRQRFQIRSNRESGFGRYDLMLIPHHNQDPGIVIEFKLANSPESLSSSAQHAMNQLKHMQYATELKSLGTSSVHLWGMAFFQKQVCIRHEIV